MICYMDIRELKPVFEEAFDVLPACRKETALRFRRTEDQLRCTAAGLLLKYVLNLNEDTDVERDSFGKPLIKKEVHSGNGPFFSLTHAGNYAALAFGESPVGIDAEELGVFPRAVMKRCFMQDEREWAERKDTDLRCYAVWTMKESIMKADGRGIAMDPRSFSVFNSGWRTDYTVYDGHIFACASHEVPDLRMSRVDPLAGAEYSCSPHSYCF